MMKGLEGSGEWMDRVRMREGSPQKDACLYRRTMKSPVGELTLVAGERGLRAILWEDDAPSRVPLGPMADAEGHALLVEAERQLQEYFAGVRREFELALDPVGTEFQRRVWQALTRIPYGETRSYGELAREMGHPTAVRAVGAANGRNPISIVVPCHRVIGASGKLTGFAGGLEAKAYLLGLEKGRGEVRSVESGGRSVEEQGELEL